MTVQEALLEYFNKCPSIESRGENNYVSLDWIDDNITCSITANGDGMGGVIYRDILGNEIKQHSFMFNTMFPYTKDVLTMIENSSFFEDLMYWVAINNKQKVLPEFDDGRTALKIELTQTPILLDIDENAQWGRYGIIFRLIYTERRI